MPTRPAPDWDPRDPSVLRDQRTAYDEMRERCPVASSTFLGWSLFHHADIGDVLADPATYSSASRHLAIPNGMDPPQHTLYRRALEPYFTRDWMTAFEPRCRPLAANLVQTLLASDGADAVGGFAEPFSLQSACAFLGWPPATWEDLLGWTHGNQEASLSRDREAGERLAREFAGYVDTQIRARRETREGAGEDITSRLMATEVDGALLSDEAIISILRNWVAGHGTVAAGIGILTLYLAEHPEDQQRLRAQPDLLPRAVDEILRADGPLVANRRTTTRNVEIGGRSIAAGEKLTLIWIAADRDPATFTDPYAVCFDRDETGNYLFGAGIHDCVGAPLARLEMRVALEELLARTTSIALAGTPERGVYPSNGLTRLPIRVA
jgi:cytochrome P450